MDVGGYVFKVNLEVLMKERSLLSEMFSSKGKTPVMKDADGCYFIDRPGRYFGLILGYMQTGDLAWPTNENRKKALLKEIEYYEIQSLLDLSKTLK
uniref:Potassium channel tetramerisation-type BTB domain-containing protein n=1 Tax=Arcella intermedia TaxID=1963864 RepID=A0A6B2LTB5_9EUKA